MGIKRTATAAIAVTLCCVGCAAAPQPPPPLDLGSEFYEYMAEQRHENEETCRLMIEREELARDAQRKGSLPYASEQFEQPEWCRDTDDDQEDRDRADYSTFGK